MSFSWFIAKRYIGSQRRAGFLSFITSFAILGVMLGTAALIITLSILDGFEREIMQKVIGFTSHIQVQGFHGQSLSDYQHSMETVKKEISGIKAISPYAAREAMIRFKENVDGVYLKGIDVETDVSMIRTLMDEGAFISNTPGVHQIVLGKKLANKLSVDVGDKLVIFGLPRNSPGTIQPRAMQFNLVGIYESGMAEYDDIYAYTTLGSAQNLFQLGDDVTGFDVLVGDISSVNSVATQMQNILRYPHYARTVFQNYRNLFAWVELQKKLSPILLGLIIIVATVNIIGTLLMFVLDKTQAIGILKSLGASPRGIQRIFLLQGLAVAIVGIGLGNLLAFVLCWLQLRFRVISLPSEIYYMNAVPVELNLGNFILVTLLTAILCLLTSVLPSRAAGKLDAVTSLRFG